MDAIVISELEVSYSVGVTEAERAHPQRLLVSVELSLDFESAANTDDLAETINYDKVCQRIFHLGEGCHWQLIETVAVDLAQMLLEEFSPQSVNVEVKKFVIPQARYVAARVRRPL